MIWMSTVKIFFLISTIAILAFNVNASATTGHVLSSRSDPSIRDRLPKIEMNATSHSIVMTLHPATINDGTIKRFRLQYGINFPYQHTIYINKNQTSVFVDKLEPNQKYIFSLIALNENNDTVIPEQFYDFQMPSEDDDRQPPKTPLELNLIPRSKTSVLLQWTDVDFPKSSRLPSSRRYKIQVNELDLHQQIVKQQEILTNNEQSHLIENLKPLTNYEFAVKAIDGDLESDYSLAIEYSNAIYPIKQLNMITNNDPSKVTLTWHLPEDISGIKSFNIYYNEQGEQGQEQKVSVPVELTQTTISNLKPNTKYLFKVASVNQFNDESTPETRLYKTPNIIDTKNNDDNKITNQNLFGWPSLGLSNNSWLFILIGIGAVCLCLLFTGIMICSRANCCSCLSNNKKHIHDSPSHIHQRQYSPTSNTASSSLIKPTDLWAGAECLSPVTATVRNSNAGDRHYETSSTAGSTTLQRCNHHHHHLYHHSQEAQPLTNNIELNNDQSRHSYVPSNDGSSSIDGNTSGFTINGKFNSSMRTRPIAVGGSFEQPIQKKSMKNLPMGTAFIMNHSNVNQQQQQHVTVRPIQQKAQYIVRPNEQSHSIGSGPSSPDYQHSPSNSHCSSNLNPPSIQSNTLTGTVLYDKISNPNTNGETSDHQRALLLSSKPNLRSFTVPVAPPIIPPPTITNKQQTNSVPNNSQYKSPFRSPNRPMLNNYSKELKSINSDAIDANPADVLEDVRNQLGNLMKKDFQC